MRRYRVPLLLLLLLSLMPLPSFASFPQGKGTEERQQATVRGTLVCLDETGRRVATGRDCASLEQSFALDSTDGHLYRFSPDDPMIEVFMDSLVRERELQITGRFRGKGELEIIKVQSVRQGKLYDIYYYCDVCNITRNSGGLCPCCRRELEFTEAPSQIPDF